MPSTPRNRLLPQEEGHSQVRSVLLLFTLLWNVLIYCVWALHRLIYENTRASHNSYHFIFWKTYLFYIGLLQCAVNQQIRKKKQSLFTHLFTLVHTLIRTLIHTLVQICSLTLIHTHVYTLKMLVHAYSLTYSDACSHTHSHTRSHTHLHTRSHTRSHTHLSFTFFRQTRL